MAATYPPWVLFFPILGLCDIPRSDASRKCSDILRLFDTVNGRNSANQLRLVQIFPYKMQVLFIFLAQKHMTREKHMTQPFGNSFTPVGKNHGESLDAFNICGENFPRRQSPTFRWSIEVKNVGNWCVSFQTCIFFWLLFWKLVWFLWDFVAVAKIHRKKVGPGVLTRETCERNLFRRAGPMNALM